MHPSTNTAKCFVFYFFGPPCYFGIAKATLLAKVAPLYVQLVGLCKNGVFPNVKMGAAIGATHLKAAISDDTRGVGPMSSDANIRLRVISSHFRDVFTLEDTRRRTVAQAGMGPWFFSYRNK